VAVEYLLPCECGRKLPVQSRQAGQKVHCECGRAIVVPTMRDLGRLEQRHNSDAAVVGPWSTRSALIALGLLVTLIGVGLTAYVYWKMPRFDPVATGREVNGMSPYETWQWWRYYERGIPRYPSDELIEAKQRELYLRRWSYFTIGIGIFGLVIVLLGALAPALAPRRPRSHQR